MGLRVFNDWAVSYLRAHPPASPFLAELDAAFPAFMEREYRGERREAVLQAIAYERALSKAFDAPEGESLADSAPADLMAARLRLAPHLTPLRVDWDFAEYRARCLPDEGLEAELEPEPAEARLVIYRAADLDIMKQPVSPAALAVLGAFSEPATVSEAFERLEGALSPEEQEEMAANLSGWFRDWVARGWLCLDPDPEATGAGESEAG
jgi:hypothetical protein